MWNNSARAALLFLCLFNLSDRALAQSAASPPVFRFHLSIEPSGLDPARISSSESNYFLHNVLRGLMKVDQAGKARPELAESCTWRKAHTKLHCRLRKNLRWSDGRALLAADFVSSWRRLLGPSAKGVGATIATTLKNAKAVHAGKAKPETLGVRALSPRELEVTLEENDPEFVQRLAHPAMAVIREDSDYSPAGASAAAVSGPYKVVAWQPRLRLEANPNYYAYAGAKPQPPPVEILFLSEDETAMNLYREGTLTFLRRLPTHYLKSWRLSPELRQIPVARFDYVGFGPELREQLEFRQALASALNYQELNELYDALGVPGCPGLDPTWMQTTPCLKFSLKEAQEHWAKVPTELKERRWKLSFSKLGGDDIVKGMEWMQNQWKKHLGLKLELEAVEQGVYLQRLRTDPPALFRKGVGLERASCLSALEIFSPGNPENFIGLTHPDFSAKLRSLQRAVGRAEEPTRCSELIQWMIDRAEIIPLGRIHFSMLAKPEFTGWVLNPLNQLDLTELRVARPTTSPSPPVKN